MHAPLHERELFGLVGTRKSPAIDAAVERGWGAIDSFTWDAAAYELTGDFGRIRVDAASVESLLTGPV